MARRIVICLDTNYLVLALVVGSAESERIQKWLRQNEILGIPSISWYEFLCGPVGPEEIQVIQTIATGGVLTFGEREAREAGRLYNATGRVRRLRVDAMIAATAMVAGASLATSNRKDFEAFAEQGLRLI